MAVRPSEFGSLLLRVRPADADVIVDGEVWRRSAGEDQFVIELSEGPHRIEVRKDGFQMYATTVRVRRGETVRLNVSLTCGWSGRGILISKTAPPSGAFAAVTVPPWRSTMAWTIESPRPLPDILVALRAASAL